MVRCTYCATWGKLDPSLGALLAEADLRRLDPPGFTLPNAKYMRLEGNGELVADMPGGDQVHVLVNTASTYDDFDVRLAFRLLWGDQDSTRVGLCLRESKVGEYRAWLSTQATYTLVHQPVKGERKSFIGWTRHSALKDKPGEVNELRVVLVGDRIRMLINGVQVASVRDTAETFGKFQVACYSQARMGVALSHLSVWEPPAADRK